MAVSRAFQGEIAGENERLKEKVALLERKNVNLDYQVKHNRDLWKTHLENARRDWEAQHAGEVEGLRQQLADAEKLRGDFEQLKAEAEKLRLEASEAGRLKVEVERLEIEVAQAGVFQKQRDAAQREVRELRAEVEGLRPRAEEAETLKGKAQDLESRVKTLEEERKDSFSSGYLLGEATLAYELITQTHEIIKSRCSLVVEDYVNRVGGKIEDLQPPPEPTPDPGLSPSSFLGGDSPGETDTRVEPGDEAEAMVHEYQEKEAEATAAEAPPLQTVLPEQEVPLHQEAPPPQEGDCP